MTETERTAGGKIRGDAGEVFAAFLKLGLTSFGGPVAHLGYFRDELVVRRGWVSDRAYLDLVALCQFLPGPASSQVGFALGLQRAGFAGALAAWAAFTLPSALFLVLFAHGAALFDGSLGAGILHGLKLAAIAVVAQAVWGMARGFCRHWAGMLIALASTLVLVAGQFPLAQVGVIAAGAVAGALLLGGAGQADDAATGIALSRRTGAVALSLFFALLILLPVASAAVDGRELAVFDAFYRAGALVFGGGHVVLPLLEQEVVASGWVSRDAFLAGYGAAQAVPGPLFSFAAYLGAALDGAGTAPVNAGLALVAIFLPGFLLLIGVLPFWNALRAVSGVRAGMAGANAAVVGLLAAALYDPLVTTTIAGLADALVAGAGFLALVLWRAPPWVIVLGCAAAGAFFR